MLVPTQLPPTPCAKSLLGISHGYPRAGFADEDGPPSSPTSAVCSRRRAVLYWPSQCTVGRVPPFSTFSYQGWTRGMALGCCKRDPKNAPLARRLDLLSKYSFDESPEKWAPLCLALNPNSLQVLVHEQAFHVVRHPGPYAILSNT